MPPTYQRGDPLWSDCPRCGAELRLPHPVNFGRWVRWRRKAAGVLMAPFAKELGISPSHLSDLERGCRTWTRLNARKALRLFGVPPAAEDPPVSRGRSVAFTRTKEQVRALLAGEGLL